MTLRRAVSLSQVGVPIQVCYIVPMDPDFRADSAWQASETEAAITWKDFSLFLPVDDHREQILRAIRAHVDSVRLSYCFTFG